MPIRPHTCVIADCDTPGCSPFDDHDYTPHFDSAEQAVTQLIAEWEWTHIDGVLRCHDCTAVYQCEQEGHDWHRFLTDQKAQAAQDHCHRCPAERYLAIT